jgi:hypothetical protein
MSALSLGIRAAIVFLVVFVTHRRGVATIYDSRWSVHTAMSIVSEGNADLDEYAGVIPDDDYRIEVLDGHLYPKYPVAVPVIAVPFVFVIDRLWGSSLAFDLYEYLKRTPFEQSEGELTFIELSIASFIVAATTVLIYMLASWSLSRAQSLLVALIFGFCTSSWSTASRALWQHGPSMLMLTATLCLILLAKKKPSLIQFAGVPLAFSVVIRPTNSISFVLLTVFVLVQHRRHFVGFVLGAVIAAIPFLLFNLSVYGSLLPLYYRPTAGTTYYGMEIAVGANPDFLQALAANLLSPARGLFVFSPILLFSIYGVISKMRSGQFERLDWFLLAIIVLHWIVISSFTGWWAGWSFGPRYFADMLPYLTHFVVSAVAVISRLSGLRRAAPVFVFLTFAVISFFIHYRGATSAEVHHWNGFPVNVDLQPSRVWDWRDIQFLRGIR